MNTLNSNTFLKVSNQGPLIKSTNFWETEMAKEGNLFLSFNAGAARLLVPKNHKNLPDMTACDYVILTRGRWQGQPSYELLFEDNSDSPFVIHMNGATFDRLLPESEAGRDLPLYIYVPEGGKPVLAARKPVRFRVAPHLPCMKPIRNIPALPDEPAPSHAPEESAFRQAVVPQELAHLTLTTGHLRNSPAHEVPPEVIEALAPLVQSGGGPIPKCPGWSCEITCDAGGAVFHFSKRGIPCILCMLAWDANKAEEQWSLALECTYTELLDGISTKMPVTLPWLAVDILPTCILLCSASDMMLMGDLERCLAWTILHTSEHSPCARSASHLPR